MVVRAVLFDAFGTLVAPEPGWEKLRIDCLIIVHGSWRGRAIPLRAFLDAYEKVRARQVAEAQRGLHQVDFAERFSDAVIACGAPEAEAREWGVAAAERYHQYQQALIHAYDDPAPLLQALRASGQRIAIVSNYAHGGVLRAALTRLNLLSLVDLVIVSGEVGYLKPHPAMFAAALKALRVEPVEAVMVGDDLACDVAGARKAGMRAVWSPFPRVAHSLAPQQPDADATIARLSDLPKILASW